MAKLQAGYFIEPIIKTLAENTKKSSIGKLLEYLSYFDFESNKEVKIDNPDPVVVVANNLISRGLPTTPTTFIEDRIATTFVKSSKFSNENNFEYRFINDELNQEILRALHIIEPRLTKEKINRFLYDNNKLSKYFINEFVPVNIGVFFLQLLTKDRKLSNIYKNSETTLNGNDENAELFDNKPFKFDFSVELPYKINGTEGLSVNFETPTAQIEKDYKQQELLEEALAKMDWASNAKISSFNYENFSEDEQKIINFTFDDYFDNLRQNYRTPLYNTDYGLDAMQIALTPLAVARIQKVIISYILSGHLNLKAEKWDIAVIERDVPAAFLAIEDLTKTINNLFELEGAGRKLPKIELSIFYTPEFENAELNVLYQGRIEPLEDFNPNEKFDLLIDISVLLRSNFDFEKINSNADIYAKVRSVDYVEVERNFITAEKINYRFDKNNEILSDCLNYFCKNILKKAELSEIQLEFLEKNFANRNILGVLPATEDRVKLYQFLTLLQPGISIIITPMVSSIKTHLHSLNELNIDSLAYFSSANNKIFDKYSALKKIKRGQTVFNFITPDCLHLVEYRETLQEAVANGVKISHIIVDEAHCASAWSYDFRPFYSTIKNNFEIIFGQEIPSFVCLTQTASYDVVIDVTKKFNIRRKNVLKFDSNFDDYSLKFRQIEAYECASEDETIKVLEQAKADNLKKELEAETVIFGYNPKITKSRIENETLKVKSFCGSIGDKALTTSSLKSVNSSNNLKDFNAKQLDVLSASFAAGSGNIFAKNVYFQGIPTSVERFIQTLGAVKNSEQLNCEVNYGVSKLSLFKSKCSLSEIGDLVEKQGVEPSFDEDLQRRNAFVRQNKSVKKEYFIIQELLNKINYPNISMIKTLEYRIRYSFDLWVRIECQELEKSIKLYVYDNEEEALGYVDFEINKIFNLASASKLDLAKQILSFLKFEVRKLEKNGNEITKISESKPIEDSEGLNNLWNNLQENEQKTLKVGFYNNAPNSLIAKLKDDRDVEIVEQEIIDIYEDSTTSDIFVEKLYNYIGLDKIIHKNSIADVKKMYFNFRNYFDTLYVIQKLYSIGALNDFVIDFNNQNFTLTISKKSDATIINNVFNSISPFFTNIKANEIYKQLPKINGASIVEKAVIFYEKFYFENIVDKKLKSYNYIDKIIRDYTGKEDKIKSVLNNYFSAKNILFFEERLDKSFTFVVDMFEENEFLIDDLHHIFHSTELLLKTHTDNYMLLVVNGICGAILFDKKQEELNIALKNISQGLTFYRLNTQKPEVDNKLNWILELLSKFNPQAAEEIEMYLTLKIHSDWIKYFNEKIDLKLT